MLEWLRGSFPHSFDVALDVLAIRLACAFAFGGAVAAIYYGTHRRDETYQSSFVATLVLLTILIAIVTVVIGESQARAFSLVGALAIIRFRTVVQDTRDTAFVIFAVAIGMAMGVGNLSAGTMGLGVGGIAALVTRPGPAAIPDLSPDWSLTVRVGLGAIPAELEGLYRKHLDACEATGAGTSRQGSALELTYRVRLARTTVPAAFVGELNRLEGVQQVELRRF